MMVQEESTNVLVSLGKLILTGAVTAFTTWAAAKWAVKRELEKARETKGFARQVEWYEQARTELRQVRAYRGATDTVTLYNALGGPDFTATSTLWEEQRHAIECVDELTLSSSIYASAATVKVLAALGERLRKQEPYLYVLTTGDGDDEAMRFMLGVAGLNAKRPLPELQEEAAKATSELHEQMESALSHLVNETRRLHGYPPLGHSEGLTATAIRSAMRPSLTMRELTPLRRAP